MLDTRTILLAMCCAALLLPPTVEGQTQLSPGPAVAALSIGQIVRVQAPGTSVEQGSVSEVDAGTLYVLEGGQEWLIDIETIERLEVRGRSIGKNVLLFGAVGALAGVAGEKFREGQPVWPFAVGGVLFGAGFGYTQHHWRVTYPR